MSYENYSVTNKQNMRGAKQAKAENANDKITCLVPPSRMSRIKD